MFVIIEYKDKLKPYLNEMVKCEENILVLAYQPKTEAYKYLFNQVNTIYMRWCIILHTHKILYTYDVLLMCEGFASLEAVIKSMSNDCDVGVAS